MMELNYSVNQGVLKIRDKVINLPYPVVESLSLQNLVIVRVEPEIGQIFNKNIFALDDKGEIEWQIAESPHGTEQDKPYVSITIAKESQLIAGNWNGVDYVINVFDGSIVASRLSK